MNSVANFALPQIEQQISQLPFQEQLRLMEWLAHTLYQQGFKSRSENGQSVAAQVITRDPDIMSGEPVFHGTRVPIQSLFDHLRAGDSLDDFLDGFPSVTRQQAETLLQLSFHTCAVIELCQEEVELLQKLPEFAGIQKVVA